MSVKKIKQHNSENFLTDLKRVREVLVFASETGSFFKITKKELKREAKIGNIKYYISDKVFVSKRDSMIVI